MTWVAVAIGGATLVNGLMSSNAASNAASGATNAANQSNATNQAQFNQTRADATPWRNAGGASMNQLGYLMGLPGYGPQSQQGGSLGSSMGGPRTVMGGLPSGPEGWVPRPQPGVEGATAYGGPMMLNNDPSQPYDPSQLQAFFDAQGQGGGYGGQGGGVQGGSLGQAMGQDQGSPAYNSAMGGYGSLSTPFSATNFQTDPGYQFRLSEGAKALERSAASKGMTMSGAQQQALSRYNQGFASNEYGNVYNRYNNDQTNLFNRLSGIAGSGQQSNQYMGTLGANMANLNGQNSMGAATVSGNAGMYGAGQWGNALNTGANLWQQYVNGQTADANAMHFA